MDRVSHMGQSDQSDSRLDSGIAGMAAETLQGITSLRGRVRSLEVDKARLQGENAILQATVAGLAAQALAFRDEVARVAPESHLLEVDGAFEDGSQRERSHAVYDAAHDQKIRTLGLPGEPSMYRARKAVKAS